MNYLERPENKDDIDKMNISTVEKEQKKYSIDTNNMLHYQNLGFIDNKILFKNKSSFIGLFVAADTLDKKLYKDSSDIGNVLIEIKLNAKMLDLDMKPFNLDPGYVNTKRYFIKRGYLCLSDSLKVKNNK